jgi:transposase InsO family protein
LDWSEDPAGAPTSVLARADRHDRHDHVLDREFSTPAPDTKWVTDVTVFNIGDRKVFDNSIAENFFDHLKGPSHHNRFDSVEELITELDEYIGWYNTARSSTTLKGLSPVEDRAQALAA